MDRTRFIQGGLLAGVLLLTAGCAAFTTRVDHSKSGDQAGLVYRLPSRGLVVTYTVEDKKAATWSVKTSAPVPDMSTRLVLQFRRSLLGDAEATIGVSPSGLLVSSYSKTTGGIDDLLVSVADFAGSIRTTRALSQNCLAVGTYTLELDATTVSDLIAGTVQVEHCGKFVTILPREFSEQPHEKLTKNRRLQGVFYRQDAPFIVCLRDQRPLDKPAQRSTEEPQQDAPIHEGGIDPCSPAALGTALRFTALLPNASPTEFLPIHSTIFADSSANFEFVDGMPKKYEQKSGSEVIGALAIPAKVIAAYFGAVGAAFQKRQGANTNEKAWLLSVNQLQVQQRKHELCIQAIAHDDAAGIAAHCN